MSVITRFATWSTIQGIMSADCAEIEGLCGQVTQDGGVWVAEVWFARFDEQSDREVAMPNILHVKCSSAEYARFQVEQAFEGLVTGLSGRITF